MFLVVSVQKDRYNFSINEERYMLEKGANWAIEREYGHPNDLQFTEASGFLQHANADAASQRALERGKNQLGHTRFWQPFSLRYKWLTASFTGKLLMRWD